jgi:uncharacterized membrane protein
MARVLVLQDRSVESMMLLGVRIAWILEIAGTFVWRKCYEYSAKTCSIGFRVFGQEEELFPGRANEVAYGFMTAETALF